MAQTCGAASALSTACGSAGRLQLTHFLQLSYVPAAVAPSRWCKSDKTGRCRCRKVALVQEGPARTDVPQSIGIGVGVSAQVTPALGRVTGTPWAVTAVCR